MGRFLGRRILQMIPVLFGTTFLVFALVYALPGDPVQALAGDREVPANVREYLDERYHLDDPLIVQYGHYLAGIARGDFGETLNGRPVSDLLQERWPVTIKLALTAFVIEIVVGLAAGIVAALRRGKASDHLILISTLVAMAIPAFVLGRVAQLLFGVRWDLFPIAGIQEGWPTSYLLPAMVLAAFSLAYVSRLTRGSLIDSLQADYVRTATAKGLPRRRVVGVHALRNSLLPVVTFLGLDLGILMGGAVVTEGVFNLPGVGQQLFRSIQLGEATVVVGMVTILVLIYLVANLLVDVLHARLDPRIRYE